jgi:glycosyltransferase involved in cell wall biosynthesis
VIPVYNGADVLHQCLEGLSSTLGVSWECIVVDDGCTDDSAEIAQLWGARLIHSEQPRSGPARARNLGASFARAPLLCFIDADVRVHPDTLAELVTLFNGNPSIDAAFGSYDTQPTQRGTLSQYRNLLHHFVHQTGQESASTFWSGCGAIRKSRFLALGGFSSAYPRPSIEDIELGYRLRSAGGHIRLAKHIQVTHLKRWTFWGILVTDIRDRALPWTDLIRRTGHLPNDLNLKMSGRVSAVSVYLLAALGVIGLWKRAAWIAAGLPLSVLLTCNRDLYYFFLKQRGPFFLVSAMLMHWLYLAYSSGAFACATAFASPPTGRKKWPRDSVEIQ